MEKISYKLDVFEGPLDLLLFLISKHKLNICDVRISELLEQFMAYLDRMQMADMEISSEFLEMASRLVYIKTVELLPKHEEADELKKELQGQLLEYQACREMAQRLGTDYIGGSVFVRDPQPYEPDKNYRNIHDPTLLLMAYEAILGKKRRRLPPPISSFQGTVLHKIVSVDSKIISILRLMYKNATVKISRIFGSARSKSDAVATFLALLELIRGGRLRVDDDQMAVTMQPRKKV